MRFAAPSRLLGPSGESATRPGASHRWQQARWHTLARPPPTTLQPRLQFLHRPPAPQPAAWRQGASRTAPQSRLPLLLARVAAQVHASDARLLRTAARAAPTAVVRLARLLRRRLARGAREPRVGGTCLRPTRTAQGTSAGNRSISSGHAPYRVRFGPQVQSPAGAPAASGPAGPLRVVQEPHACRSVSAAPPKSAHSPGAAPEGERPGTPPSCALRSPGDRRDLRSRPAPPSCALCQK